MTRIAIVGGAGRMGQTLARGLGALDDMEVVALVDPHEPAELGGARYEASIEGLGAHDVDVVVDVSVAASVVRSARWCAEHGVALVVGTTGLSEDDRAELAAAGERTGVVVAANFAIGAVLAERFAAWAAPYFERAEVIEMHHDAKVDAPSGTALTTAKRIGRAKVASGGAFEPDPTRKFVVEGARGASVDGVGIHSLRIRGAIAHQEVVMGTMGQSLTIRHDSYDRSSFMPGVIIAIRGIASVTGLNIGVDDLIEGMFNSMSTDRAR